MSAVHESERALLGGLLEEPDRWPSIAPLVAEADFSRPEHGNLWRLLARRIASGQPIGVVEIAADVTPAALEACGGMAYVAELPAHCPSATNLGHYASQISEAAMRRRLLALSQQIAEAAERKGPLADLSASELVEQFHRDASEITDARTPFGSSLVDAFSAHELELQQGSRAIATGFGELDRILDGGFHLGDLSVIGARASMGKTALAIGITCNMAERGVPVGFLSLEMPTSKIAARAVSYLATVDHVAIRTGRRTTEQRETIGAWSPVLPELRVWRRPFATLAHVTAEIRHQVHHAGVRVVFLDYLTQLAEPPLHRGESTPEKWGRVVRVLKELAEQLGIHVCVLSQLSRESERRAETGRRTLHPDPSEPWFRQVALPLPSDLVWSSDVEAAADVILFPLRAEKMLDDSAFANDACVVVAKHRSGATGVAPARWHGSTASYRPFTSPAPMFHGVPVAP